MLFGLSLFFFCVNVVECTEWAKNLTVLESLSAIFNGIERCSIYRTFFLLFFMSPYIQTYKNVFLAHHVDDSTLIVDCCSML